jgi:hypothetical protein
VKVSSRARLRRRDFVGWLGGAALALPALELFERDLRAQTAGKKSKFAVFCYTPDGVNQKTFWPTGTTAAFTLGPILAPFEAFKDKMLLLGPQLENGVAKTGTGLAYAGSTLQHQAPVCLTARMGPLPYADQATAVNPLDGPSIDQVIGDAVKGESPFSSLNFGMHPIGGDTPSDINYSKTGAPLKRMASADEAFTRVFGTAPAGASPVPSEARRHVAVSNYLHARFGALAPQVSAHDRQVLDAHLTSLRAYEDRKAKLLMSASQCTQPPKPTVPSDATAVRTGSDTEGMSAFFMDVIATAFACNTTKVATVTFGYPGGGDAGGLRMPWLGFTDPLHGVSHHGNNPATLEKYTKMHAWIAGQIARLMQQLAATKDATGQTLLDQTTIYWFNRHGDGDAHSNFALPNVILGGTGGYFRMGRFLQLPATSPTKVLISIANAMGVDVPTFGKDALKDTAALAGLV